MYNELLYHLDLCMLSYHLHAQTLIWPLDPYMEQVATTTTERRENFLKHTHEHFDGKGAYRGPGGAQGWPTNVLLDPIMSRYNRLYPWRPVFLCTERRDWLWHNSPKAIIDPVEKVFMNSYVTGHDPMTSPYPVPLPGPRPIADRPVTVPPTPGNDRIYCFEGGTGTIGGSAASWSLMGFCLARHNGDGTYDVHITFRGSRSGAAGRAALAGIKSDSRNFAVRKRDESGQRSWALPTRGKHVPRGNGDWVTDMDVSETVDDSAVSVYGQASRGFSSSMKTAAPLVVGCLQAIHNWKGAAPRLIWVTGHSLGGALAGEMTSALICGDKYGPYGSKLSAQLQTWPWKTLRLVTMSAPVVGGDRFHTTLNSKVYARRVLLGHDPITQSLRHYHIGAQVHLGETPGSTAGFPYTDHHEPYKVRRSLLVHLNHWQEAHAVPIPLDHQTDHVNEPWKKYGSFQALLHAQNIGADIPAMMATFPAELIHYITIVRETFKDKTTHKAGHGSLKPWKDRVSTTEKAEYDTKCNDAINLLNGTTQGTPAQWNSCLEGVGGTSFNKFLRLSMLMAASVLGVQDNGHAMDLNAVINRFDLGDI